MHINAPQAGNVIKFQDKLHPPFWKVKGKESRIAKLLDAVRVTEGLFSFIAGHKFVKAAGAEIGAGELPDELGKGHEIGGVHA